MDHLKDIKGLEGISIWPIAYGWIVILAVVISIGVVWYLMDRKKKNFNNSWKFSAIKKIDKLRSQLGEESIVGDLFLLLKEVSLKKFGREKCAHLTGVIWLKWLNQNDKNDFDWVARGSKLVEIQYSPAAELRKVINDGKIKDDLKSMIDAILNLIKK